MRKVYIMLLTICLSSIAIILVSCNRNYPITVNNLQFKSSPERIVSLSPSLSEIFMDIDKIDILVGITKDNNYHPEISNRGIEIVGETADPNIDKIISLKPDLVISSGPISSKDQAILNENKIPFLTITMPKNIDELEKIYQNIAEISYGKIEGAKKAKKSFSNIKNSLEEISSKLSNNYKSFLYINSLDGLVATGDTFESSILSAIGKNIAKEGKNYDFDISNSNPEIILIPSNISINQIKSSKIFGSIEAVKNDKIYTVNNILLNRQNHRSIEAIKELINNIYPDIFNNSNPNENNNISSN